MEKLLREFIQFCFERGSSLRNYREFGKMSQKLLEEAIKHDLGAREGALANTIVSDTYAPELLVAVAPAMDYKQLHREPGQLVLPAFVIVYRFYKRVSETEFIYVFDGGRTTQ